MSEARGRATCLTCLTSGTTRAPLTLAQTQRLRLATDTRSGAGK